ncbi:MAG: hypothetical protein RJB62_1914 [Pseudomonadota bacterium]|jgi:hypothetical protein
MNLKTAAALTLGLAAAIPFTAAQASAQDLPPEGDKELYCSSLMFALSLRNFSDPERADEYQYASDSLFSSAQFTFLDAGVPGDVYMPIYEQYSAETDQATMGGGTLKYPIDECMTLAGIY